jgi:hypothetical protein
VRRRPNHVQTISTVGIPSPWASSAGLGAQPIVSAHHFPITWVPNGPLDARHCAPGIAHDKKIDIADHFASSMSRRVPTRRSQRLGWNQRPSLPVLLLAAAVFWGAHTWNKMRQLTPTPPGPPLPVWVEFHGGVGDAWLEKRLARVLCGLSPTETCNHTDKVIYDLATLDETTGGDRRLIARAVAKMVGACGKLPKGTAPSVLSDSGVWKSVPRVEEAAQAVFEQDVAPLWPRRCDRIDASSYSFSWKTFKEAAHANHGTTTDLTPNPMAGLRQPWHPCCANWVAWAAPGHV